jgi:nitrite reductase/ring-hydroxylating ferredoxin subunit
MPFVKVGPSPELAPGQVVEAQAGDRTFAVCNVDGKLYCLDGVCPHAGGPLGQGVLQGQTLTCPWHGWEFNCVTGANVEDEDLVVDQYKIVVENGEILIDVPES